MTNELIFLFRFFKIESEQDEI